VWLPWRLASPNFRVLVVEDKKENWLVLQRILESAGFRVRVAEDGAQGVEMFENWRPHFIWMDLRLPIMGGVEATRRIRELEGGREVRIVAVTASAFSDQREQVLAAGLDDFLRKPHRPEEIFECMARHLGVRYLYSQAAPASSPGPPLNPEALAALPEDIREKLADALVRLKTRRIAQIIGRISEFDGSLGRALSRYADKFAYAEILSALEANRTTAVAERA
jgi:CheY-like chemotaxis protein